MALVQAVSATNRQQAVSTDTLVALESTTGPHVDRLVRPLDQSNATHAFINDAACRAAQGRRCTETMYTRLELIAPEGEQSFFSATLMHHETERRYGWITSTSNWERLDDISSVHRAAFFASMTSLTQPEHIYGFTQQIDSRPTITNGLVARDVYPMRSLAGLRNYAGSFVEIRYHHVGERASAPDMVTARLTDILFDRERPTITYEREVLGTVRTGKVGHVHEISSVSLVSNIGSEYRVRSEQGGLEKFERATAAGTQIGVLTTAFAKSGGGAGVVMSGRFLGLDESRKGVIVEIAAPTGGAPTLVNLSEQLIQSIKVPEGQVSPRVPIYQLR